MRTGKVIYNLECWRPFFLAFVGVCACSLTTRTTSAQNTLDNEAANSFGGEIADEGVEENATPDDSQLEGEQDPVVIAIRNSAPSTPEELIKAIRIMMGIGRLDQTKLYLGTLLAANLPAQDLAEINRRFGSAMFIELGRDPSYAPEGRQLAEAVFGAAKQQAEDQNRIGQLISQLVDPQISGRRLARLDLQRCGEAAIAPMIAALADAKQARFHGALADVFVEWGEVNANALTAALESSDAAFQCRVMAILSRIESRQSVAWLVGPMFKKQSNSEVRLAAEAALQKILGVVPSQGDAERYLYRQTKRFLAGDLTGTLNLEDLIPTWRWNDSAKTIALQPLNPRETSLFTAVRFASELYSIAPEQQKFRSIYLIALWKRDKYLVGIDGPLPTEVGSANEVAAAVGVAAVEDALLQAVKMGEEAAALGAVESLGRIADGSLVQSTAGRMRPLAQMLRHPNQRLRFAAAQTIAGFDLQEPFPGSSFVVEILAHACQTSGGQRALVGHPRAQEAQRIGGMLAELGWEADSSATGDEILLLAQQGVDLELILVSDIIDHPPVSETIQLLRRDPQSAHLPVVIMTRTGNFERMQLIARQDPLTISLPRPHDPTALTYQVTKAANLARDQRVPQDVRVRHGSLALDVLARLAKNQNAYGFYDLYRHEASLQTALQHRRLSEKAARILGDLGSTNAQHALVSLASQNARPLSQREAAAEAFTNAVRLRGLLLTKNQIGEQYKRYNASENLDVATQRVLGSLLDTIEAPTAMPREGTNQSDGE